MLILFVAIITVIIFFHSAKKNGENGVSWALTGLVGYILGIAMGMILIGETLISTFIGCFVTYVAHKLMVKRAQKNKVAE